MERIRIYHFLSREGEDREVVGERLRDKTVPWQVHLASALPNDFSGGSGGRVVGEK
jgi:hypothetical protein